MLWPQRPGWRFQGFKVLGYCKRPHGHCTFKIHGRFIEYFRTRRAGLRGCTGSFGKTVETQEHYTILSS